MNNKKKDGQKQMKLPRFSYQIPEDLTPVFLAEMQEDFRETASELITAIMRRHFQKKIEEKMIKQMATEGPEVSSIPHYGPKPSQEDHDQAISQSSGEE